MNANRQTTVITGNNKERTMKITTSGLIRWTGLAAMGAGIIFAGIQPIHPLDVLSSVTTGQWAITESLKTVMAFLGLFGMAGLYVRQVKAAGWLGLAGYLLFSLFFALTTAFAFAEAFILPLLATEAPTFVEGFLGIFNGHPIETNLGALPALYALAALGYVLGGLLFGIATFRAGILPRWAGGLLAFAAVSPLLLASLLPHPLDRILAVPMGISLIWLGYALWSERRAPVSEPVPGRASPQLRPTAAE
jgi:hypothetical protein